MPIRTIQTQEQAAALIARWPNAYTNRDWRIGYIADWNQEATAILDRLCRPGPAQRKALEKWWTVESVNIPG